VYSYGGGARKEISGAYWNHLFALVDPEEEGKRKKKNV